MRTNIFEARKIWDIPHSDFAEAEYQRRLRDKPLSGMGEIHPDLVRYKGCFYCCFGEPRDPDPVFCETTGNLRIIRSADGVKWETVSLGKAGRRFSITADGQLMVNKYHWVPPRAADELGSGDARKPVRESATYLTSDGVEWSGPYNDEGYNTFRWDVAWHKGRVDLEGDGTLRPAREALGPQMGGPKLMRLRDGRLLLAGKADASTPAANLGRNEFYWPDFDRHVLTRFAQFDGYMHYPGVVEREGVLWLTCGKRGPFEVWLIKVSLPAPTHCARRS